MQVVYARQEIPSDTGNSLFLAGPTPRLHFVPSWRKEALQLLNVKVFEGIVFVPEDEEKDSWDEEKYLGEQIEWEEAALHAATCILFWIPRDLVTLPGFTTNIEFGRWMDSGKIILGAPPGARKMSYLYYYAEKLKIPTATTLEETIRLALLKIKLARVAQDYPSR